MEGVKRVKYISVLFKKTQKTRYFKNQLKEIMVGDDVLLKTPRGLEVGEVVEVSDEDDVRGLTLVEGKVVRKLKPKDYEKLALLREKEQKARQLCEEKVAELNIPLKLLEVEWLFDDKKVVYYFTSEGRIDFRELVKQLGSELKVRVEMRQLGVRDEAKIIGGLGPCGRNLCCATFLTQFEPVSVKMAKEQGLPLNTFKISGLCGRLMCCLKYEYDDYVGKPKCKTNKNEQIECQCAGGNGGKNGSQS